MKLILIIVALLIIAFIVLIVWIIREWKRQDRINECREKSFKKYREQLNK
jgi:uncharacterized protein YoxC